MKKDVEVLISENDLLNRISEIAEDIKKDFKDKDITLICILKGSIIFTADLSRRLNSNNVEIEVMDVSSYGLGSVSKGEITVNKELETSIEGKNVILLEDIIDTGNTLKFLYEYLKEKNPSVLKVCALLDKPSRRVADIEPDYIGFTVPDKFIVGYGLDYAEKYRNLPYIGTLDL